MYFLKAVVLGFATLAAAQSSSLKFTSAPSKVVVGQTYDLTYTAADESAPVTITLKSGPSGNLKDVETLTTSATGGSYSWTVGSYPDGQYALEIKQGSEINYWGPFPLTGGSTSSSPSAAASSPSAAASSPSTAASSPSAAASSSVPGSSSSSSSATGYTSITLSSNSTMTMTGTAYSASGSGMTTMHRNTTMSSATLKTKSTTKSASKTASVTKGGASSSSQASATTSHPGASSVPTGGAAAGIASPFVLLFGVMGAMAYLN